MEQLVLTEFDESYRNIKNVKILKSSSTLPRTVTYIDFSSVLPLFLKYATQAYVPDWFFVILSSSSCKEIELEVMELSVME